VSKGSNYSPASDDNNTEVDEEEAIDPAQSHTPVSIYPSILHMHGALTVQQPPKPEPVCEL
jgi:hypothetical protein